MEVAQMSDQSDGTPDIPSDIEFGYIALNEIFTNFVNAGFTENQACQIIAHIALNSVNTGGNEQ